MYDIGQMKGNHFCMLIFAQGKWKRNYGEQLFEKIQANWLNFTASIGSREENSLFDPVKEKKKCKDCKICLAIQEVLQKEMKDSNHLLLFSHYVPEAEGLKSLLTSLMENPQVQKIYYLEQNSAYYLMPPDQFIAKVKQNLRQRVSLAEFIRVIDFGRFETGVLYEIFRQSLF